MSWPLRCTGCRAVAACVAVSRGLRAPRASLRTLYNQPASRKTRRRAWPPWFECRAAAAGVAASRFLRAPRASPRILYTQPASSETWRRCRRRTGAGAGERRHAPNRPVGRCGRAPAQQATHGSGIRHATADHAAFPRGVRAAPWSGGFPPAEPGAREHLPPGHRRRSATGQLEAVRSAVARRRPAPGSATGQQLQLLDLHGDV